MDTALSYHEQQLELKQTEWQLFCKKYFWMIHAGEFTGIVSREQFSSWISPNMQDKNYFEWYCLSLSLFGIESHFDQYNRIRQIRIPKCTLDIAKDVGKDINQ